MEDKTKVDILLKEYENGIQLLLYHYNIQARALWGALAVAFGVLAIMIQKPEFLKDWEKVLLIFMPPMIILFIIFQLFQGLWNHLTRESIRSIEKAVNKLSGNSLLKFYTEYESIVLGGKHGFFLKLATVFHIVIYAPFIFLYWYSTLRVGEYYSLLRIVYIRIVVYMGLPIAVGLVLWFCRRAVFKKCAKIPDRIPNS